MKSLFAKSGQVLLCLLLTVSNGLAAKDALIVGVENQYYLPVYAYEKGVYQGFARELLDTFAQDQGYRIEYRALPVPRLYASFIAGQVDFKFPDNPRWKQDQRVGKQIVYSEPVLSFVDGVSLPPNKRKMPLDGIKRLGTVGGFTPWAWIDRIESGKTQLSENSSLEALVRQTLAGRVDGAYASVAVINYQLDHVLKQPGALVFDPSLPNSRDSYYLSSIKRPKVVLEFNAWMRENQDRIAALKTKHAVEKGLTTH
jgi:ABC-type amino acid transport substrate-binding protein